MSGHLILEHVARHSHLSLSCTEIHFLDSSAAAAAAATVVVPPPKEQLFSLRYRAEPEVVIPGRTTKSSIFQLMHQLTRPQQQHPGVTV